jgi:hypothetical protein
MSPVTVTLLESPIKKTHQGNHVLKELINITLCEINEIHNLTCS